MVTSASYCSNSFEILVVCFGEGLALVTDNKYTKKQLLKKQIKQSGFRALFGRKRTKYVVKCGQSKHSFPNYLIHSILL